MLDIDSGLDSKLDALFEHIKASPPPPALADITKPAPSRRRRTINFAAGLAAVVVVAASVTVFAVELGKHHGPAGQSPASQPSLPAASGTFTPPVGSKTLVPATNGTGKVRLPAFTPTERYVYIELYCTGGGSLIITSQPAQGGFPDPSSCLGGLSIGEFDRDELMSGPLGLSVNAPASSRWQILVYETNQFFDGASVSPSAMPATWDTFTAPPGSKTLIAATKGTGTVTLQTFTPTEWYYIVSSCTGGGSMVIASQPTEGGPGSSSCLGTGADDFVGPADEVMGEPLTLTVTAPPSSHWEILVYETNQPDGT